MSRKGWIGKAVEYTTIVMLLALAILATAPFAHAVDQVSALVGRPAPPFTVRSGDDTPLSSDTLKGKVVIIFYETREANKKNSDIKDRFNKLYDRQDEETRRAIVRIPVFDCSRTIWPVTAIWKQGLRYHSKRVGMTLYGDWDGRMARDFRMKDDDSNLVIIDRRGIVRYASTGRISDEQFSEIEELLDRLVNREK